MRVRRPFRFQLPSSRICGPDERSCLLASQDRIPTLTANYDLRILDGLRGLAALYVLLGHARFLLWEGYSAGYIHHPDQYTALGKAIVYASGAFIFGHQAVLLFFVLSGFVIHLRYSKRLRADGPNAYFDLGSFVYRRAKRLYPPLIAAMVLTALLDGYGMGNGYPIYFGLTPYDLLNRTVKASYGWGVFVGNLAFVMDTYVPTWGTDAPLWSLKFEWWFYMLYPAFWWVSKKSLALATAVMTTLFLLSFSPAPWPATLLREVFSAMICWWLGVLLADAFTGRLSLRFAHVAPAALLLLVLPLARLNGSLSDFVWAVGFAGLIAACFALQERGKDLRLLSALKPLGDMSYTLYVIHMPIVVLLSGWLTALNPAHELPRHFGWALAGVMISLVCAYVIHLFAEKPFVAKRREAT
jgi:peptidoglycan/LPS O-acetylase OafA/YrhL